MLIDDQYYENETIKKIVMKGGTLNTAEFSDCTFRDSSFIESTFKDCRFVDCVFQDCDLSLIQIPGSTFQSVQFKHSKLIGVDWTRANWPETRLADDLIFSNCALNHATFIGLKLPGLKIISCAAVDIDFREANLRGADFAGTDLSQSIFHSTDLSAADLSQARNYAIDPSKNILKGARFSLPEALALLKCMDIILED
jgi:uncharacterized protein YjbI with pentapeptide repeats